MVFQIKKQELPIYKNNDELPLILSAKDVAGYMGVSLCLAYELMRSADFPSVQIKKCYKVQKDQFVNWINNATGKII